MKLRITAPVAMAVDDEVVLQWARQLWLDDMRGVMQPEKWARNHPLPEDVEDAALYLEHRRYLTFADPATYCHRCGEQYGDYHGSRCSDCPLYEGC